MVTMSQYSGNYLASVNTSYDSRTTGHRAACNMRMQLQSSRSVKGKKSLRKVSPIWGVGSNTVTPAR